MSFEDFVNTELPLRVSTQIQPTAGRYLRFKGWGVEGLGVEERTVAQVLADIGALDEAAADLLYEALGAVATHAAVEGAHHAAMKYRFWIPFALDTIPGSSFTP